MFQEKEQFMTKEDIKTLQLERIRKQVDHAYKNVAFYRRKFDEIGLRPEDIRTLEDVGKIPLTVKD
ncbi:MAG: phenylacetate--CoA ligase, partial [Thermoplasmatota archaeon]